MPALLALLLTLQSPVERLDDDDPDIREEAMAALARDGSRAMGDLERALCHHSLEVRARAADLLIRLPEHSWRLLAMEQPLLAPLWNALIDSLVLKKPVPAELWEKLGCGEKQELEVLVERTGRIQVMSHAPAWIARRFMEEGTAALRRLGDLHGVEGRKETASRADQLRLASCAVPDLPERLARFGADDDALEEIHAAILLGRDTSLAEVFNDLSPEDWDLVLRFLVHLRRRPGAAAAKPPGSREEALQLLAKGPWAAGIGRALRAAVNREGLELLEKEAEERAPEPHGDWRHLEQVHRELGRLDSALARRGYHLRSGLPISDPEMEVLFLILKEKP